LCSLGRLTARQVQTNLGPTSPPDEESSPVDGAPPDLHDNVMNACRNALADFKVPREIRFVDEMPRSTLEKVAKAELRKMLG